MTEFSSSPPSRILADVLNSLLSSTTVSSSESREYVASLQNDFTLASVLCEEKGGTANNCILALEGGLTEADIRRFAPPSTPMLNTQAQNLISEQVDSILRSIADLWDASTPGSGGEQEHSSEGLLHDIQTRLRQIEALEAEADDAYDRIHLQLQAIQQIHPRLQQRLTHGLDKFPQEIESRSAANNDLLAMTIESSLVKVSLVRAQVLELVYNYSSPKNPELQMRHVLSTAYTKLKDDEGELEMEEQKLNKELAEYQTLLDMVDGGGSGGFRQLVADTARVEKETEECRRDLRRLGWTGEV
ncbi:hypothetical protein DFH06DRAFT_1100535 [Mycena polygramma]|nr:hypothetical protein DFH06DRAFT_1100535 [Mycena polygramma]